MSDAHPETLFLDPFPLEAAALQLQELEQQSFAAPPHSQHVADAALIGGGAVGEINSNNNNNNPLETLAAASPDPAAAAQKKKRARKHTKLTAQEENELLKRQLAEREQEIVLLKQQLGKTTAATTVSTAAPQAFPVNPTTASLVGDAVLAFAASKHELPGDPNEIKNLRERWKARFQQLVRFKLQYGHCNVSKTDDMQLHSWVRKQRTNKQVRDRTNGTKGLTREQFESLESIGFQWIVGIGKRPYVKDDQWQSNYEKLMQYRNLHGHVPVSIPLDKPLTKWMQNQRSRKKLLQEYGPAKSKGMTWDRVQRLDALGFKWGSKDQIV